MKNSIIFLGWVICVLLSLESMHGYAQKPQWIGNTPKELNHTYKFVEIISHGTSLEIARENAKSGLENDTQLQEGIRIYRKTKDYTTIDKIRLNRNPLEETTQTHIEIETTVDGERFHLQAVKIDEYPESSKGYLKLHTLYMVALCDNPVFDRTYLTTSYGAKPVLMSVIPGFGQWYKGNKAKGICLFATEAVAVVGIIICDNHKASYIKKAKEQPKFMREYSDKANKWEIGRNICMSAAAGIWIYNLVDAAVAKGCRRVIVHRQDGGGLAIAPFVTNEASLGLSFAYRF